MQPAHDTRVVVTALIAATAAALFGRYLTSALEMDDLPEERLEAGFVNLLQDVARLAFASRPEAGRLRALPRSEAKYRSRSRSWSIPGPDRCLVGIPSALSMCYKAAGGSASRRAAAL